MEWTEVAIHTSHEAQDAVADIFYAAGAGGVVIEDPQSILARNAEATWDYLELPPSFFELEGVIVKGYLPSDDELAAKLKEIERRLSLLSSFGLNPGSAKVKLTQVAEEDWATAWKAYYKPVKVGEHFVVKPTWEHYEPAEGEIIIELDPGMAFGTGTHPTTVMCIQALEKLVKGGERVFDLGCGSGILSIAAAKLGAGEVWAVDVDSTAVRVSQENVALNGVESKVTVLQGDLAANLSGRADLIVANIVADIIIRLCKEVTPYLKPTTRLVFSGIINDRLADVTEAMAEAGLTAEEIRETDDWVVVIAALRAAE